MMCFILWTTLAGFVATSIGLPQDYVGSATSPHAEVITDNASEVFNISVPSTTLPDPQVGESSQSVPYSPCNNSTTEYEGENTVRTLEQKCDSSDTCCKQEDITTVPPQSSAPTKREDITTVPPQSSAPTKREDITTVPPQSSAPTKREDITTVPPQFSAPTKREDITTVPPQSSAPTKREDITTVPPQSCAPTKREDFTTVPPQSSAPTKRMCGNRKKDSLAEIIGITRADYAEFPWMVGVLRLPTDVSLGLEYLCGGSLIRPQVVLTAAHCVKVKENLMVRVGEWDIRTDMETYPSPDLKVREVITHEQFEERTLNNGVALLILEQPVNMSFPNVGLICLPEANENMDNRDCVASGWGKDEFGKNSEILKKVDGLPMVPRSRCQEALRNTTELGPRFRLHESFVCAGGIPGKDMCKGDGGSPLVCPSKNDSDVYVQAGIVSWGIDCNTETPGVYVNVALFVNWIENKLQSAGF